MNAVLGGFWKWAGVGAVLAVAMGVAGASAGLGPARKSAKDSLDPPAAQSVPENAWPKLTDEQQARAIESLKKFADASALELGRPLKMFETKFFLFYSDLPPAEAQNWAGLLDRMYARLADLFAVKKGENVWVGKALVFVFSQADDYRRYEAEILHTDPGTTAGMCHSYSSGLVKIAFYRQKEERAFAHVLVHESVHGFIHRYRTPVLIPSWANEGLAETIATELVPQPGRANMVKTRAREELQRHQGIGDFFEADHISAWQYPVAEELCTFMIQFGKKNYVDFINGIKEGVECQESLSTKFKAPRNRLVPAFGQWLGMKQL